MHKKNIDDKMNLPEVARIPEVEVEGILEPSGVTITTIRVIDNKMTRQRIIFSLINKNSYVIGVTKLVIVQLIAGFLGRRLIMTRNSQLMTRQSNHLLTKVKQMNLLII